MNINATIFIQAFNFFIVYWMLRIFLFKPVIGILDHEAAEEKSMIDIIDQQKKSLEIQEKERQRHWYVCQEYFAIHQPYQHAELFLIADTLEYQPIHVHELSTNEIGHIITDVRTTLEEKIKHVH